ncbi:Alpha/beta hydrolase family protein [Microbulbifer donghaiensis]|uniref:Alpha/beta hydrolase family protein n=1 Tax=Microbulbifer donghaiensis TaxID=494016 RepID=A0A1M5EBC7_9GAMM|nr:alpha/beta fold hydrolase [Microbulbifer donghaiensis]SHF76381.1 Alpha/beta hydrolase family protein [Microbulbifer donghaiensis]
MQQQIHTLKFGPFLVPVTVSRRAGDGPLALVLPALGVPAVKYERLRQVLHDRGYHTAVAELPGTGDSRPRPHRGADYDYSDLVFTFIPQLLRLLERQFPAGPELILGHSIGGQAATLAARAGLTGAARVVSVASGHIHYRCWQGTQRLSLLWAAAMAGLLANLLGYFPGARLGFGGREARGLMTDWSRSILSGRFAPEKRMAPAWQGPQPTLHIALAGDPFAPLKATQRLAAITGGEARQMPAPHPQGNPHLSWIKSPQPIVAAVEQWLQQDRTPAPATEAAD